LTVDVGACLYITIGSKQKCGLVANDQFVGNMDNVCKARIDRTYLGTREGNPGGS